MQPSPLTQQMLVGQGLQDPRYSRDWAHSMLKNVYPCPKAMANVNQRQQLQATAYPWNRPCSLTKHVQLMNRTWLVFGYGFGLV